MVKLRYSGGWTSPCDLVVISKVSVTMPNTWFLKNLLHYYFYCSPLIRSTKGRLTNSFNEGWCNKHLKLIQCWLTKINRAWYSRDDQISSLQLGMIKEQMDKNKSRDEKMAQLDLLSNHIFEGEFKSVNSVGRNSGQCWTK